MTDEEQIIAETTSGFEAWSAWDIDQIITRSSGAGAGLGFGFRTRGMRRWGLSLSTPLTNEQRTTFLLRAARDNVIAAHAASGERKGFPAGGTQRGCRVPDLRRA